MLLRLLLARKGHYPGTERRADGQENPEHRNQAVSDSPRHHLPPGLREYSGYGVADKGSPRLAGDAACLVPFAPEYRTIL